MTRSLLAAAAGLAVSVAVSAAPTPKAETVVYVNLKEYANVKLGENLHSDAYPNNNLKALPTGKQKLGDVTFEIGAGILQLGSSQVQGKPTKIEGIKVGKPVKMLHFLHGTGFGTDEGTVIGKYVIRYDDKTTAEVEVVYGRDVVDWWAYPDQKAPTQAKVAWEGENEAAAGFNAKIKLYLMSWENPSPAKGVVSIDFLAPDPEQAAAP